MPASFDLVCLSHLRWDFVYQRPQHLLSRCARERRVFYVEEPIFGEGPARLHLSEEVDGVRVAVPLLPEGLDPAEVVAAQRTLLDRLLAEQDVRRYVLWYYTPAAVAFSRHLEPLATVYDVMDELSAFKFAPPALRANEAELFERADLVFTGGQSLFEAKRGLHQDVRLFPSSVDAAHFGRAREPLPEPADQRDILHPRLGYFGVVDERIDLELLAGLAAARPDWQLVVVGPVAKIEETALPQATNLHYLGAKIYEELPAYIAGWDVALMPFAHNEATRFISPTKGPEYLAAGRPVVSTSIRDVVTPYGDRGLIRVADGVTETVAAVEAALGEDRNERLRRADEFLAETSWDRTWTGMRAAVDELLERAARSRRAVGAV